MFNGLIKEIATVVKFDKKILSLKANFKPNLGDSIAVNGACLSVIGIDKNGFELELSSETLRSIAIENYKQKVHIEPAIRFGDRIDGHLLQGHIDAIGEFYKIEKLKTGTNFYIKLPKNIMCLVSNKGSIAIDGVSLTISEVLDNAVRLTLIPLSLKDTLFNEFKVGRRVNVETDLLARYIQRIVEKQKQNNLTWGEADFYASLY